MNLPAKKPGMHSSMEVLEARIAPARLILVGSSTGDDNLYSSAVFVDTAATVDTDVISGVVGKGEVAGVTPDAKTYYMKLGPGDALLIKSPTSVYRPFISAPITQAVDVEDTPGLACTVVAFFVDKDKDGKVDEDELTGLSLGNNARVQVHGVVNGDVVGNYNDRFGKLGSQEEPDKRATVLPENTISQFTAVGVRGSIISGGPINGIRVTGSVGQILSGSAAQGYTYDFFFGGSAPGALILDGGDTLQVSPGARKSGTSIKNVSVGNLGTIGKVGDMGPNSTDFGKADYLGLIRAGNGGDGGLGGSISGVLVVNDLDGFTIQAGGGGEEGASGARGGAGGSLSDILVFGLNSGTDEADASNIRYVFKAGAGGGSTVGAGGAGGSLKSIFFGFEGSSTSNAKQSTGVLSGNVFLEAGAGGSGTSGGAGGGISSSKVISAPVSNLGVIQLKAGAGGGQVGAGGSAGGGGSISNVEIANPGNTDAHRLAKIEVLGGNGGNPANPGEARGGKGGSVSSVKLAGFIVDLSGGVGGNGTLGGAGGSVSDISVGAGAITSGGQITSIIGVEPEKIKVTAGSGGTGSVGVGGSGGSVSRITVQNADLSEFVINGGLGGGSKVGNGGAGGSISSISIIDEKATARADFLDADTDPATESKRAKQTAVTLNGGGGGVGGEGAGNRGGAGGSVFSVDVRGWDLSLSVNGGAGGIANFQSPRGNGGAGGRLSDITFESFNITEAEAGSASTTVLLTAGGGGRSIVSGTAGAGGSVSGINIRVSGDITVQAGTGGSVAAGALGAATGTAGVGGSVWSATVESTGEDVAIRAGNAGTGGVNPAAGGSLDAPSSALRRGVNLGVSAAKTVVLAAGNGGDGGTGGNIRNVNVFGVNDLPPGGAPPAGLVLQPSITVTAGNGSAIANKAGAGGSILGYRGEVATVGVTLLKAGEGGGSTTTTAAGGSGGGISGVKIFGGGGAGSELRIEAGNGGNTRDGATGGAGGSISDVQVDNLEDFTVFRRIAAGDGGNSTSGRSGGNGGSVSNVDVNYDIGVLMGRAIAVGAPGFGYNQMGGIFAGSFGTGALVDGVSGSVTKISADAIAAIAAGKLDLGGKLLRKNLVSRVATIVLNGNTPIEVDGTGKVNNYTVANFVGGIVNPAAVGAAYNSDGVTVGGPHANTFDPGEYTDNSNGVFGLGDTITASTDGFVAAVVYDGKTSSVRPEAVLTLSSTLTSGELGAKLAASSKSVSLGLGVLVPSLTAGSFTVNGSSVSVTLSMTLAQVLTAIQIAAPSVTANYDPVTDKVTLSSATPITLAAGGSDFLAKFKLVQNGTGTVVSSAAVGVVEEGLALSELRLANRITRAGSIVVNDKPVTYSPSDTLEQLLSRINATAGINVTASYDVDTDQIKLMSPSPIALKAGSSSSNLLTAFKLAQNGTGTVASGTSLGVVDATKSLATGGFLGATGGSGSFRVNGALVSFDPAVDTLNTLLSKINKSAAGVTARYDALQDRILVTAKSDGKVYVEETASGLATAGLKLTKTVDGISLSFDAVQFIDLNNTNGQVRKIGV